MNRESQSGPGVSPLVFLGPPSNFLAPFMGRVFRQLPQRLKDTSLFMVAYGYQPPIFSSQKQEVTVPSVHEHLVVVVSFVGMPELPCPSQPNTTINCPIGIAFPPQHSKEVFLLVSDFGNVCPMVKVQIGCEGSLIIFLHLTEATSSIQFIEGRQRESDDFLGHINDTLESLPRCSCAIGKP